MLLVQDVFSNNEHIQFLTELGYASSQDINQTSLLTCSSILHDAIQLNRLDIIKILVQYDINLDEPDTCPGTRRGRTPLISAIIEGRNEIALFLIQNGADKEKCREIGHETLKGWSPLMTAVVMANVKIASALLEEKVNVNQENLLADFPHKHKTALMYATASDADDVLEHMPNLLIKGGAKLKNSQGMEIPRRYVEKIRHSFPDSLLVKKIDELKHTPKLDSFNKALEKHPVAPSTTALINGKINQPEYKSKTTFEKTEFSSGGTYTRQEMCKDRQPIASNLGYPQGISIHSFSRKEKKQTIGSGSTSIDRAIPQGKFSF
jgi:hypothetical protein